MKTSENYDLYQAFYWLFWPQDASQPIRLLEKHAVKPRDRLNYSL